MYKNNVEEWLWDISAMKLKHYHSDTSILISGMFKEYCKYNNEINSFLVLVTSIKITKQGVPSRL